MVTETERAPGCVEVSVSCQVVGGIVSMKDRRGFRTIGRPGQTPRNARHVLVDLGPHGAPAIPVGGGVAGRDLGDVEGHGARVGDRGLGVVRDGLAGGDVVDAGRPLAGEALVAPDLVRVDVRHGAVALEVGRLAHDLPVGGVADAGEGVW
jgi:hypothetical protein